jgi:hypothetical protein
MYLTVPFVLRISASHLPGGSGLAPRAHGCTEALARPGPAGRGPIGPGALAFLLIRRAGPAAHEWGAAGPSSTHPTGPPYLAAASARVSYAEIEAEVVLSLLIGH